MTGQIALKDIYYCKQQLDTDPAGVAIVLSGTAVQGPVMTPLCLSDTDALTVFGSNSKLYQEWYCAKTNGASNIYMVRTNGCHATFSFGTKLILNATQSAFNDILLSAQVVEIDDTLCLTLSGRSTIRALIYTLVDTTLIQLATRINRDALNGISDFYAVSWESGAATTLGDPGETADVDLGIKDGTEIYRNVLQLIDMTEPYPVAQLGITELDAIEVQDGRALYDHVSDCATRKMELGAPCLYTIGLTGGYPELTEKADTLITALTADPPYNINVSEWVNVIAGQYIINFGGDLTISGVGTYCGIVSRRNQSGGTTGSAAIGVMIHVGMENLTEDTRLTDLGFIRFRDNMQGRQRVWRVGRGANLVRSFGKTFFQMEWEESGAWDDAEEQDLVVTIPAMMSSVANVLVVQRLAFSLSERLMDEFSGTTERSIANALDTILSLDGEVMEYSYEITREFLSGGWVWKVVVSIMIPGELEFVSFQVKSR